MMNGGGMLEKLKMDGVYLGEGKNGGSIFKGRNKWGSILMHRKNGRGHICD